MTTTSAWARQKQMRRTAKLQSCGGSSYEHGLCGSYRSWRRFRQPAGRMEGTMTSTRDGIPGTSTKEDEHAPLQVLAVLARGWRCFRSIRPPGRREPYNKQTPFFPTAILLFPVVVASWLTPKRRLQLCRKRAPACFPSRPRSPSLSSASCPGRTVAMCECWRRIAVGASFEANDPVVFTALFPRVGIICRLL